MSFSVENLSLPEGILTHTIHVWCIYLHLVDFYGKCREIYHTWILWVIVCFSFLGGCWEEVSKPSQHFVVTILHHGTIVKMYLPAPNRCLTSNHKERNTTIKNNQDNYLAILFDLFCGVNRDLQLGDEKVTLNHLVTAKIQSQNFYFKTSSDPTAPGYPFLLIFRPFIGAPIFTPIFVPPKVRSSWP